MTALAWTVNDSGAVQTYQQDGSSALYSPGGKDFAEDISVGADGTVWIVSTDTKQRYLGNVIKYFLNP